MNRKKIYILGLVLILFILLFIFNSKSDLVVLKSGRYVLDNSELGFPSLILKDDTSENKFFLSLSVTDSYIIYGDYIINRNKLILNTEDNKKYIFKIKENSLILKYTDDQRNKFKKGAIFKWHKN